MRKEARTHTSFGERIERGREQVASNVQVDISRVFTDLGKVEGAESEVRSLDFEVGSVLCVCSCV